MAPPPGNKSTADVSQSRGVVAAPSFHLPLRPRNRILNLMSRYLQTVSALLLFVMVSAFGQNGIRQCLCTGQIAVTRIAEPPAEPSSDCCNKQCGGHSHDGVMPRPCDGDSCWVFISLDAVESCSAKVPLPAPLALAPSRIAAADALPTPDSAQLLPSRSRPPDRSPVSLTVLYDSFLI